MCDQQKIFKIHPIHSNYLISTDGDVYSLISNRLLSKRINDNGYVVCTITVSTNFYRIKKVHRLVAETYLENPRSLRTVNHKDGDKLNNSVSNLEWMSYRENLLHARETGLNNSVGEGHGNNSYPESLIRSVCSDMENGLANYELVDKYDLRKDYLSAIRTKKIWTHVSCDYDIKSTPKTKLSKKDAHILCRKIIETDDPYSLIGCCINGKVINKTALERVLRKETFKNISDVYF